MNRAIARRTLFESQRDIRVFLARVAETVRAHRLEVHAFCVLTTHFHMLVRSPVGELSEAMRLIQNEYARWFNRSRRRDGPLHRGRFLSKPVTSEAYRWQLVRYIDANPVQAGMCARSSEYPHGSASRYATERGPLWLERGWVEACVARWMERPYQPEDYPKVFGGHVSERLARLVERRIGGPTPGPDPLDDLLGSTSEQVARWMQSKAALADGAAVGVPVCDPEDVRDVLTDARSRVGPWRLPGCRKHRSAWDVVHVALLRELCGATLAASAAAGGTTIASAARRCEHHRRCMQEDELYATRIGVLAREIVTRSHAGARIR